MTTPVQYFGKLLCLSLFVVPSPLVEAKKSNPLELLSFYSPYHAEAAAANKAAAANAAKAKAAATRFAAAQRAAARKAELAKLTAPRARPQVSG